MKKYQKYDVATGQEFVGDIQTEDIQLANSLICELDGANIGTIAIDDVVYILGNGKIIKAIANNAYCNYQLGIVKAINGTSYTVQVDGIVEHSQPLTNDLSKEVYATSDKSGRNLVDKLEVPFFNDDTAVIVGKKLSSNKIKLSPEFFIFGDPEPNFVNDGSLGIHLPLAGDYLDYSGNNLTVTPGTGMSYVYNPFDVVNGATRFPTSSATLSFPRPLPSNDPTIQKYTIMCWVKVPFAGETTRLLFYDNYNHIQLEWATTQRAIVYNNVSRYRYSAANIVNNGNWHHFVVVHDWSDNYRLDIYIDGILRNGSGPGTQIPNNLRSNFVLGPAATRNLDVCDFRIYDRAWTTKEVSRYWRYCNSHQVAL